MGRPKGSVNKNKLLPLGRNDAVNTSPSLEISVDVPTEAASPKKGTYTALEWKIAEALHEMCMMPGCVSKNHLFGARRIIELVLE